VKARILYLIGDLNMGGAQRQLVYLAQHLDRGQFEPVVCCLRDNAPLAEELRTAGVEVVVLRQWLRPDVSRFWRIPQVVKRYRPDLIHAYLFVANTWGRTTGLMYGLPVIVSERTAVKRKDLGECLVNRLLAPFATALIANSQAGASLAVQHKEIAPDRVHVVHNGIVLEPFHNPTVGNQIRQEFQIRPEQSVIGIVGRLAPAKDHRTFFQAMRLVAVQFPDLRIMCVGDGALRGELERLVGELGLQPNVIFTGNRTDIPAIMFALDILVLSSQWEGFPNVIMEAMAAARPVVATEVGDVTELVIPGQSGLLVKPGEPEAIAGAVVSLLRNKALRLAMGQEGRKRIEEKFTHEHMVAATSAVYRQLLESFGRE
jgi:glycosyltransferase involved in cell wall biosynthesis